MSKLLHYWADSLRLLWSSKLQLILFGISRGLLASYRLLVVQWGWFIVACLIIDRSLPDMFLRIGYMYGATCLWSALAVLVVRPSVTQKTYSYYRGFMSFMLAVASLSLFLYVAGLFFGVSYLGFFMLAFGIYSPFYIAFLICMSDATASLVDSVVGMKNGLRMVVYNYPLLLLVQLIFIALWHGIVFLLATQLLFLFGILYASFVGLLLLPAYICSLDALYVLWRHEQRELYTQD